MDDNINGRRKNGRTKKNRTTLHSQDISVTPQDISVTPQDISVTPQDISVTPQDISVTPQDISVTPQDISVTPQDISVTPQDISVTPQDISVTPQDISVTPQDISVTPQDISVTNFAKNDYVISKNNNTRNYSDESDVFVIPMESEQVKVYSWMGFNPALLLNPTPSNDNVMIWVNESKGDSETSLKHARSGFVFDIAQPHDMIQRQKNTKNNLKDMVLKSEKVPEKASIFVQDILRNKVEFPRDRDLNTLDKPAVSTQGNIKAISIIPVSEIDERKEENGRIRRRRSSAN